MKDGEGTFNVLESIEKHIEALKPLLLKQALVCIGEYPIKTILKVPNITKEVTLPILIEKSTDEIYKWLPKGYDAHFVLGFEDEHIDTHFWYNVLPTILKNNSVLESLKKKSIEKLRGAIIFSSVWDGIGSASLPALIGKFKATNIDSLSIAVLPSKIQPTDAHFNAYAALEMCLATDGATVLLLDRDHVENYEGVDRKGEIIKGNMIANYLLNMFLVKNSLVEEISELSRTFNTKLFTPLVVTGASYRIYGSLENILNAAFLKPFLTFDLSSASLLYVLLRMPLNLKDKLSREKIELAVTNWFKEKTSFNSIYITEPIYTEDMSDRIDVVMFIGGFETNKMKADLGTKVKRLKDQAVEKGLMREDWKVLVKTEVEPKKEEIPTQNLELPRGIEKPKKTHEIPAEIASIVEDLKSVDSSMNAVEPKIIETPTIADIPEKVENPIPVVKPKRASRTKKTENKKNLDE
jgi:hypothetical protein